MSKIVQFDNVHLNLGRRSGKLRLADTGLGWKATEETGDPFTLAANELRSANWFKASRGYELKLTQKNGTIIRIDNLGEEDYDRLAAALEEKYKLELLQEDHALKGWNWGETEFHGSELAFKVNGKNAFDLPLQYITNTNLTGKQEVSVEFELPGEEDGDDRDAKKAARHVDQMVEVRFYVPGVLEKDEDAEEEEEEMSAAQAFYDTLKDKADVGEVAGSAIAAFSDVVLLTPRGRYDVDMYETSMRLRGKTYDYKVQFSHILNMFLLPRSDEQNVIFVVGLDPPLRQGQTRYPFLIFQFSRNEETEVELNVDDDVYEEKYKDRMKKKYDQATFEVMSQIFRGLTGKKVTTPSSYKSYHDQPCIKCNNKANEGALYLLDKSVLFVTKPTIFIPFSEISSVTLSRVGASISAGKTFDISIASRTGTDHQFTSINREEQENLEAFLKSKNVKVKNDLIEDTAALLSAALKAEAEEDDDDLPVVRGDSGDEDEDSPDEDFVASDSDSDVAEEYDSDAPLSDAGDGSDAEEQPKKKKVKTKKEED